MRVVGKGACNRLPPFYTLGKENLNDDVEVHILEDGGGSCGMRSRKNHLAKYDLRKACRCIKTFM